MLFCQSATSGDTLCHFVCKMLATIRLAKNFWSIGYDSQTVGSCLRAPGLKEHLVDERCASADQLQIIASNDQLILDGRPLDLDTCTYMSKYAELEASQGNKSMAGSLMKRFILLPVSRVFKDCLNGPDNLLVRHWRVRMSGIMELKVVSCIRDYT